MIAPIARDYRQSRRFEETENFLMNSPPRPKIKVQQATSGSSLNGNIKISKPKEDWESIKLFWRVGVLPPARHKVFSLNCDPSASSPGLTTHLPHHWEEGLDDGHWNG